MKPDELMVRSAPGGGVGNGRLKLALIVVLFFLPELVATTLYFGGWRPQSQVNHGELVQPARPIRDVSLQALDGTSFRFSALRGKWLMIYFGPSSCNVACMRDLYKMRQVSIAQGGDAARLRRLFVVTDGRAMNHLRATLQDYPGMRVVIGSAAAVASLARQFTLSVGSPLDNLNRIYLVDPLGNLMMSYPSNADPEGMRKDIVRLLQVSQVG